MELTFIVACSRGPVSKGFIIIIKVGGGPKE